MELTIPKLLDIPSKLLRIVDEYQAYRYFLAEGGRGGGKSHGIARMLLYLGEFYKLRIVCGRETQKSIEESVYTILKDLIIENSLDYAVYADSIVHRKTNSVFRFKGFREQGSINIKGLEGVDILWIDEAQAITKHTLDIIIPTIRKEKAKVFFTMNRFLKNDAVYKHFAGREDCLHIHINYFDNPFCPQALIHEAEICRLTTPDDYAHIWEGQPLEQADNYLFSERTLTDSKKIDFLQCGHHELVMGVDLARYGGDKCVATILQKRGPIKWQTVHIERWGKKDLMESTGRIVDLHGRFKPSSTSIDGDGLGAGPIDRLRELKINVNEFRGGSTETLLYPKSYANLKTEWYCLLEQEMSKGNIECAFPITIENLRVIQFTHKSNGIKIILSKETMKSKGIESPDDADSVMMAYHATSFLNEKIEEMEGYQTPLPAIAQGNLFKLAGFR